MCWDKRMLYKLSDYGLWVDEKIFDRLQSIDQSNWEIAPCTTYSKEIHRQKHHTRWKNHSSENKNIVFVAIGIESWFDCRYNKEPIYIFTDDSTVSNLLLHDYPKVAEYPWIGHRKDQLMQDYLVYRRCFYVRVDVKTYPG